MVLKNQLVWFRTDLRVRDNPALFHALRSGPSVAIYVATPQQWALHHDAPVKLDFWRRNLVALKAQLDNLNVDLICFEVARFSDIPALFSRLFCELGIAGIHYNREYPLNELRRDKLVDALCSQRGVSVSSYEREVLASPGSVLNQAGNPFKVFTPFGKKLRGRLTDDALLLSDPPTPSANPDRPGIENVSSCFEIDDIDWPVGEENWRSLWPAGEAESQSKLRLFAENKIMAYQNERDIPALDGTSSLSPYLAAGVISIGDCWRMSSRIVDNDGSRCWQNELLWREFYRHIVFHFPQVCRHQPFKQNTNSVPWQHNRADFDRWCHGETGYPLVDAGMRQLLSSGWMHNRLRMVTAMFLTKHLLIDWRWGERWFMQNLIDGDFASNNGGWQWCASTGVDAVPYFRIFSPARQSQRFDTSGAYIRTHVPELGNIKSRQIHEPVTERPKNYPSPLVNHRFARDRALQAFAEV